MKLFCAYAFTGENLDAVTERMELVVNTLRENGQEAYCNLFDPVVDDIKQKGNNKKDIFARAFSVLSGKDALVAIVSSPEKSVGQIMEIGAAVYQNKNVYLFEHTTAAGSNYLPELATTVYSWTTLADLQNSLKELCTKLDS